MKFQDIPMGSLMTFAHMEGIVYKKINDNAIKSYMRDGKMAEPSDINIYYYHYGWDNFVAHIYREKGGKRRRHRA